MPNRNDFDPWRVASALGWILLFVAVCGMAGWALALGIFNAIDRGTL